MRDSLPLRTDTSAPSLRERKKAKTKAAIQQHALRLFREQGYAATTIEQIAEAAEVSPSTVFRYFPTKEDIVMFDDLDPLLIAAFQVQPPELGPIQAMRGAIHDVLANAPAELLRLQDERTRLILTVPELRMRLLDQFAEGIDLIAKLLAERAGRRSDDFEVRTLAGAMIGVMLTVFFTDTTGTLPEYLKAMDAGLAFLEAGMPL
jgi:AcrR family transcriptional regulator